MAVVPHSLPWQSVPALTSCNTLQGKLALRFRKATEEDIDFFKPNDGKKAEAKDVDIDFKKDRRASSGIFTRTRKRGEDGKIQYRTQPAADPERVEETTWLTKEQVQEEALKPSTTWAEAGHGDMGRVYVEIIGCDDLKNLDLGVNDQTDSFAVVVFENNMVRTDVVRDCLQPRWMPWSSRAFAFNIVHPSSLLFLGVFDYDKLGGHDPIGRVVINTAKFQSNTSYLLHYCLRRDESGDDVSTVNHENVTMCRPGVLTLLVRTVLPSLFVCESNGRVRVMRLGRHLRHFRGCSSTFQARSLWSSSAIRAAVLSTWLSHPRALSRPSPRN